TDPTLARDVAQFMAKYGSVLYQRISHSIADQERAFLERRLASAERDLAKVNIKLRAFQHQHGVFDLEQQTRTVVTAIARLEALRITAHLELAYRLAFAERTESTV